MLKRWITYIYQEDNIASKQDVQGADDSSSQGEGPGLACSAAGFLVRCS